MATSALRVSARNVSIGRVFERAFATIRQNPSVTIGLAIFFGAIPNVGLQYVSLGLDPDPPVSTMILQLVVLFGLAQLITVFVQASLARTVVRHADGRTASFRECVVLVSSSIIPLICLSVLSFFAICLGLAVLIVPGVLLWVAWSVSVPVFVEERRGVIGSLRRSADLTRGARGPVFGLLLVLLVVNIGTSIGVDAISGEFQNTDGTLSPTYLSLGFLSDIILAVTSATVIASLYVELRDWKEGPGISNLEDVFA